MVAFLVLGAASGEAQETRSFWDRFLYGGEIVGNYSPKDRGYFNELEYRRNLLRLIRFNVALEFQASDHVGILTEIRSDNFDAPEPYALYLRYRPWSERALVFNVGRIPPVFGQFARRRYDIDNPLIGYPLTYQYPNTTRPDAAPTEIDQVLAQRGRGARVRYPIGNQTPLAGLPFVNPLRWDTGAQVVIGRDPVELAVALTQGTISNPRVRDDNSGKQVAARLGARPAFGVLLGFSGAHGDYVADDVSDVTGASGDQTAFGVDVELAREHVVVRAEGLWSRWDAPTIDPGALASSGFYVEGTYKISPGLYVAARVDYVHYDAVESGGTPMGWDASITRFEAGFGYYFHRQLLAKAAYQYNRRDDGPLLERHLPAVQLLFWF